jgi:hypothetical protein
MNSSNVHVRRALLALLISGIVSLALIFVGGALTDSSTHPHPAIGKALDVWGWPGEAIASALVPPGHDIAHIGAMVLVGFVSLTIFYAAIFMALIEGWARLRRSREPQPPK